MASFTGLLILNIQLLRLTIATDIFCPDSNNDDVSFTGSNDFGLNIYAQDGGSYAEDCYIRYGNLHRPSATEISGHFINPSYDTIVISHGWQGASNNNLHRTSDQWSKLVEGSCVSGANAGDIELCEPTGHDSKYWSQNGYNFIMIDWIQFATEAEVKDAEAKIYQNVYNNQTVTELIYDKLKSSLDLVGWNGNELRFVGHSLGAQLALNLAAKWKLDAGAIYANKLTRVALLDHFFSKGEKEYLPIYSDQCWVWSTCWGYYTVGKYAVDILLPGIRGGDNPAVIENYRTSPASSTWLTGDSNEALNEQTVYIQLKPWYYGSLQVEQKHKVALAIYVHCMKFTGDLNENAPNCRMNTTYLKSNYCPNDGDSKCKQTFVQNGDDGAYTTWDMDDTFTVSNV